MGAEGLKEGRKLVRQAGRVEEEQKKLPGKPCKKYPFIQRNIHFSCFEIPHPTHTMGDGVKGSEVQEGREQKTKERKKNTGDLLDYRNLSLCLEMLWFSK